jgi:putative peptide zinc metalloprotease protein
VGRGHLAFLGAGWVPSPPAESGGIWSGLPGALVVMTAQPAPAAPLGGLWAALRQEVDVAQSRPAQAEGVVARELSDRAGPYYVLKNTQARTYLRLAPREYWLWEQMDGAHSVQDLVVAYFLAHGTFAYGLVVGLTQQLFHKRMLRAEPQDVYATVRSGLARRTLGYRLMWPARVLLTRQWAIGGLDRLLSTLYRRGGRLLFSWPAQILYLLVSVIGLVLLTRILADARFQLGGPSLSASVVSLWLAAILPVVIHELGHALTVKHYQREVHRGGLMLYFGMPAAFVDTTDIWMEGKRARLAVTWAGPYTGFIIAGGCALVVWLWPGLAAGPLLLQVAVLAALTSVLNLNPLLKLDGYYLLSDALEIPKLRERSLGFIQHRLAAKLLKRERFEREEIIFLVFGALSAAWTVYIIYLSLVIWNARVVGSVRAILASQGDVGEVVVNGLLILFAISFLSLIVFQVLQIGRALLVRARRAGLLDGAGRVAVALVLLAAALLGAAIASGPALTGPLTLVLVVAALLAGLYLALLIAAELDGAPLPAAAWRAVAATMSLAGLASLLWALGTPASAGVALWAQVAAVLLAIAALLAGWQLWIGLAKSWRGWSAGLLASGAVCLLAGLIAAGGGASELTLIQANAWAGLLLAAGAWHWRSFRQPPLQANQTIIRPLATAERLWDAFELLAESAVSQLGLAYGGGTVRRAQQGFNRRSAALGWGIHLADGQLDAPSEALPVADQAEVLAMTLEALLDEVARAAGRGFAPAALARGYDVMSWDQREIAEEYMLRSVSWAGGLIEQADANQDSLERLLARTPLFVAFSPEELHALASRLKRETFARGETIIQRGDPGDRFYIARRGRLEVIKPDANGLEEVVNELVSGDTFGEAGLLSHEPRNATVRAASPVEVLSLGKADFDQLVRAGFEGRVKVDAALRRVGLLRRIPIFKDFESFELQLLASRLESVALAAGETVFEQGDAGDRFYIIESGEVAIRLRLPGGHVAEQARRGAGEYFGEIALLLQRPRTATVAATRPTCLLGLSAADFDELVRESTSLRRSLERAGSGSLLQNNQRMTRSLVVASSAASATDRPN